MSTFSRDNGPYEGFDFALWRSYIDKLQAEIDKVADLLPAAAFATSTVAAQLKVLTDNLKGVSDKVNAYPTSFTTAALTVTGILQATTSYVEILKELRAKNIVADNISMGPKLSFDKTYDARCIVGSGPWSSYYVLGKLIKTSEGKSESHKIRKPATLYVYNTADPKASAVIQATEASLAVLHSGGDFPNPIPPVALSNDLLQLVQTAENAAMTARRQTASLKLYVDAIAQSATSLLSSYEGDNTALTATLAGISEDTAEVLARSIAADEAAKVARNHAGAIDPSALPDMAQLQDECQDTVDRTGEVKAGATDLVAEITSFISDLNGAIGRTTTEMTFINSSMANDVVPCLNSTISATNASHDAVVKALEEVEKLEDYALDSTNSPPKAHYAVVRTGSSNDDYEYYVCMMLYKQGEYAAKLSNMAVKVAMINAEPVTSVTGVGAAVAEVVTTRSTDFLVSHLTVGSLDIASMTAGSIRVSGSAIFDKGLTASAESSFTDIHASGNVNASGNINSAGDMRADGDMRVVGDLTVNGTTTTDNLSVTDGFSIPPTTDLTVRKLTATQEVVTPKIKAASTGEPMLQDNTTELYVGSDTFEVVIHGSRERITYVQGGSGRTSQIAFLSDVASAVIYEGKYDFLALANTPNIPNPFPYGSHATDTRAVWSGATCLVIPVASGNYDVAKEYRFNGTSWTFVKNIDNPPDLRAFQYHVDYVREGTDTYYHEAEVIWSPSLDEKSHRVSIINLPLENYYNRKEVDDLMDTYYDLSTRQADWMVTEKTTTDKSDPSRAVDNPAYIKNKPLTGYSVLDGGSFPVPNPPLVLPATIVDGGSFNELKTNRGTVNTENNLPANGQSGWEANDFMYVKQDLSGSRAAARYKIARIGNASTGYIIEWRRDTTITSMGNFRREVLIKLWSGNEADMPAGQEYTKNTLKWCMDTHKLYVDTGVATGSGTLNGNYCINLAADNPVVSMSLASPDETKYTITHTKNNGTATTWTFASTAAGRISYTKNNNTITAAVNVADLLSVAAKVVSAVSVAAGTGLITFTTKTKGTGPSDEATSKNTTLLISGDSNVSWTEDTASTANARKFVISLSDTFLNGITSIKDTVVLKSVATEVDTSAGTAKMTVAGSKLIGSGSPVSKSLTVVGDNDVVVVPSGTDDIVATVGLTTTLRDILAEELLVNSNVSATSTSVTFETSKAGFRAKTTSPEVEKMTVTAAGRLLATVSGGTNDKTISIGFASDTESKFNQNVVKNASSGYDDTDGLTFVVVQGNFSGSSSNNVAIHIKKGDGLVMTGAVVDNDSTATLSLDPKVIPATKRVVISDAAISGKTVTLTKNQAYEPSATPTKISYTVDTSEDLRSDSTTTSGNTTNVIGLSDALLAALKTSISYQTTINGRQISFLSRSLYKPTTSSTVTMRLEANKGLAVTNATVAGDTTVTYGLNDIVSNAQVIRSVTPRFTADEDFLFDIVHDETLPDIEVTKSFGITAGDNIKLSMAGTPEVPLVKIDAVPTPYAPYVTTEFNTPDIAGTITWQRRGNMVHGQLTFSMGLSDPKSGTFVTQMPQNAWPAIKVTTGENHTSYISIDVDGTVAYYFQGMGTLYASIMYFVA